MLTPAEPKAATAEFLDSLPEHEFSESEQVLLEALLSHLGEHDGFAFRNLIICWICAKRYPR